ncbi:MAG TPA: hypothetical protein VGL61_16800 [Kofleriaceae bacterium]
MSEPAGIIRDLGYERYAGSRRAPSKRWRVLARQQIASAWQPWWQYKTAIAIAVIVTAVFGGLMYFFTDSSMFRGFRWVSNLPMTMSDGAVPASLQWFRRAAFVVSTATAATTIAGDRESGAFALYVARSTRPVDYIVGKVAAMLVLVGSITIIGPLFLALLRLGLFDDTTVLVAHLWIVPKVLAVGALTTITYAIVPLACSALFATRAQALAVWAAYWLVACSIVALLGALTSSWFAAFDPASALDSIIDQLFGLHMVRRVRFPLDLAVGSIVVHVTVALAIISICVRRAHRRGFGDA